MNINTEEEMKRLLQAVCKPVAASPEFKERLLKRLTQEVSGGAITPPRALWLRPVLWAPIAAAVALALIAYFILPLLSPSPIVTPPTGVSTGILEIRVTDAPPKHEVSAINVTIADIQVHRAGDDEDGEWIPVEITGTNPFDLVELKESGLEELLASEEITAGKYTQIRMTVDKVEVGLDGNDPEEAKLPSGELKFVRPFDVVEGQPTVLLLDFDADKSVTFAGEGKVIVKPVVRLAITPPAPVLSLEITSPEDGAELNESTVTVNGTVSDSEATVTVNGEVADVAEDGSFSAQVELTEGGNILTAVAALGKWQATDSITVTYHPPGP
jgi:hypothetical protein